MVIALQSPQTDRWNGAGLEYVSAATSEGCWSVVLHRHTDTVLEMATKDQVTGLPLIRSRSSAE
jgi:hypothetical protein